MSNDQAREIEELRERVRALEAERDARPAQTVQIEGFEGLKQLSNAIEQNRLAFFLGNKGVPDRWFWGFLGFFCLILLGMAVITLVEIGAL